MASVFSDVRRQEAATTQHLDRELAVGQISPHDHATAVRITARFRRTVEYGPTLLGGAGAGAAYWWASRVHTPPFGGPARAALVVAAGVATAPLALLPYLAERLVLLLGADDRYALNRALERARAAAAAGTPVAVEQPAASPDRPAQGSAWDAIRHGRALAATPVQDALAAAPRPQGGDGSRDDERRQWEEMLAKERGISKDQ